MKLFNKILIANRGEIAIRIIKSARKLGILTVAIYSKADETALHVRMADEAYCLGKTDLSETYLNIEKIISIAKISHAEAIHPGYGFLAENPGFVAACEASGIVFIGPDSRAMRLMGNKIESRAFVKKIGIPMTAGITGDQESLKKAGKKIPYPLLIKAAAGGGGKGMRIVHDDQELAEALESTSREAKSYFGDGTIFVEKYIVEPRHIEFQIIGDHFGNVVHLFERECSIQRRHQKIIEESPSPTVTPALRKKMGEAAVKIGREIGYRNAGTVEFLVDKDLNFYFLEMNTRVQVEHPVTEMVTGFDIVREQILIAAGNELGFKQEEVSQTGHAIECRIYAEDPANNFLPSPGQMTLYHEPSGDGVRIDTGLEKAETIHSFYDPLICKLIVWSENRDAAREKTMAALRNFVIQGIKTNIPYLTEVLRHPAYTANKINTRYCDEHTTDILAAIEAGKKAIPTDLPAMAYVVYTMNCHIIVPAATDFNIWKEIGYWRDLMEVEMSLDGKPLPIEILAAKKDYYRISTCDKMHEILVTDITGGRIGMNVDGHHVGFFISTDQKGNGFVNFSGHQFSAKRNDLLVKEDVFGSLDQDLATNGNHVSSPMPGKVIKINVMVGDRVEKGRILMVVEAMKMENNIACPRDALVEAISVKTGDMVDSSHQLITLRDADQQ
jgi:acetyl-CoA carboxylase biotin carboxylase subunit